MADVRCLKDGKFAVTNNPGRSPVAFKEGDELTGLPKNFAARLVETGFAEAIVEEEKTVTPRAKKRAERKRA